jgi:hypothetical protein
MKDNRPTLSRRLPGLALATVFLALSTLGAADADPSNSIVVVAPAALPTLARRAGEALFLHDTGEGRTLLYVEQHNGTELAIFDVTDPGRVRGRGSVKLDAPAVFDFVAHLGKRGDLVRLRDGRGDAVLDLRGTPALKTIPGLNTQNPVVLVADEDWRIAAQPLSTPIVHMARDYEIFPSADVSGIDGLIEIKEVFQETTNADTGTTFLLARSGLYLIRRPALEPKPSGGFSSDVIDPESLSPLCHSARQLR